MSGLGAVIIRDMRFVYSTVDTKGDCGCIIPANTEYVRINSAREYRIDPKSGGYYYDARIECASCRIKNNPVHNSYKGIRYSDFE